MRLLPPGEGAAGRPRGRLRRGEPSPRIPRAVPTSWPLTGQMHLPADPRSVSAIARSAWAERAVGRRPAPARERVAPARRPGTRGRPPPSGNEPRLAARAHHAAGGGREAAQVIGLAAGRARAQLRREAGGQQQLHPEGERLGAGGRCRVGVEQGELVAEQVVGGPVGLGGVEQAQHGVAGGGRALERLAALAQGRVGVDGVQPR